jgi:hypothetical protein
MGNDIQPIELVGSGAQAAAAPRDHFAQIVANWSYLGPPLRPSASDTAIVQRAVAQLNSGARAVVLGLTPEIIGCNWPADVRLSAVDHSPQMIQALWPPARGPANAEAIRGDWCTMPIESGTVDLVVGDGCYVLFAHPLGYDALTAMVEAVHEKFPGYRFRRLSGVDVHHDHARFAWDLAGPDGTIAVAGIDVAQLAPDGRLQRIIGFFGELPPVDAETGGVATVTAGASA